jgi:hypothetical protein
MLRSCRCQAWRPTVRQSARSAACAPCRQSGRPRMPCACRRRSPRQAGRTGDRPVARRGSVGKSRRCPARGGRTGAVFGEGCDAFRIVAAEEKNRMRIRKAAARRPDRCRVGKCSRGRGDGVSVALHLRYRGRDVVGVIGEASRDRRGYRAWGNYPAAFGRRPPRAAGVTR